VHLRQICKIIVGTKSAFMSGVFNTAVNNAVHYLERRDRWYIR